MASLQTDVPAEVQWVELRGGSKRAWADLPRKKQDRIYELKFVKRYTKSQIFFDRAYPETFVVTHLRPQLVKLIGSADFTCFTSEALRAQRSAQRLEERIRDPDSFSTIDLGGDVAEYDPALLEYFIATRAYSRVESGAVSVVIGPKGSGKTAILKALENRYGSRNSIVITPEVFATSMLRQVVEDGRGIWDEDQAFVSTWIFTILVEVFKRLSVDPRGVPSNTLKKLRGFLRDNASYEDVDLFTRFIGYLKRIEGVKVGQYELTLKTRMLQELYSLAPLYEIVPSLRGAGEEMLILLDELDTGWDNSAHANSFVASLLQAAIKIQSLGLRTRVVAFLRSEIFDLVQDKLDHLDKLRSGIEVIKWSLGELADVVVRRVAHSLDFHDPRTGHELQIANALFDGSVAGQGGFEYLVTRTSLRPREVLQFMRHAHQLAREAGARAITPEVLAKAEEDFSSWKFRHLCSEYRHIYPELSDLVWSFRGQGPVLSDSDALLIVEQYLEDVGSERPQWVGAPQELLQLLYSVEIIGVPRPASGKPRSGLIAQYEFSFERQSAAVRKASSFLIHPGLWSVLEVPLP